MLEQTWSFYVLTLAVFSHFSQNVKCLMEMSHDKHTSMTLQESFFVQVGDYSLWHLQTILFYIFFLFIRKQFTF